VSYYRCKYILRDTIWHDALCPRNSKSKSSGRAGGIRGRRYVNLKNTSKASETNATVLTPFRKPRCISKIAEYYNLTSLQVARHNNGTDAVSRCVMNWKMYEETFKYVGLKKCWCGSSVTAYNCISIFEVKRLLYIWRGIILKKLLNHFCTHAYLELILQVLVTPLWFVQQAYYLSKKFKYGNNCREMYLQTAYSFKTLRTHFKIKIFKKPYEICKNLAFLNLWVLGKLMSFVHEKNLHL